MKAKYNWGLLYSIASASWTSLPHDLLPTHPNDTSRLEMNYYYIYIRGTAQLIAPGDRLLYADGLNYMNDVSRSELGRRVSPIAAEFRRASSTYAGRRMPSRPCCWSLNIQSNRACRFGQRFVNVNHLLCTLDPSPQKKKKKKKRLQGKDL